SRPPLPARRSARAAWAWVGSFLVAAALVTLVGCEGADEVQHYQAPKPPKFRMLGNIIHHGDSLWFFKVSGPLAAVAASKKEGDDFVETVDFDGETRKWKAPQSWREGERRELRLATYFIGPADEPLELTVTSFPLKLKDVKLETAVLLNIDR